MNTTITTTNVPSTPSRRRRRREVYLWRPPQLRVAHLLSIAQFAIFTIISSHTCLDVSQAPRFEDGGGASSSTNKHHHHNHHHLHLQGLNGGDGVQWSNWSDWSPCSRSCDGGISVSLRKCLSPKAECLGKAERYTICNMQPCQPTSSDFRASQCAHFNKAPYRERFYEWLPFIDPADPCSLTCRAKGFHFVAQLAVSAKDGTRCRPGALDMCVAGRCLSVGCDLQLGSLAKIDDCGICGGDGSSCLKYRYAWAHHYEGNCSHACGGGVQLSSVSCRNEDTGSTVDDIFCHAKMKPRSMQRSCNDFECPPTWLTGNWTACDKRCSSGRRTRQVTCAYPTTLTPDGQHQPIPRVLPDEECSDTSKPPSEEKCNTEDCPQWYEGLWSECSENCGNGTQQRPVVCRDFQGFPSDECEPELKPASQRNCSDISKCLYGKTAVNSQEDSPSFPKVISTHPSFIVGPWSSCNASCGIGHRSRTVECKIYLEYSKTELTIPESECLGEEENGGEKPAEVEECSAEERCQGEEGVVAASAPSAVASEPQQLNQLEFMITSDRPQRPKVELSYQVLNETISTSPTTAMAAAAVQHHPKVHLYAWKVSGYTTCSHRCLGGTQDSIYSCFRLADNVTVDSGYCSGQNEPELFTRTCNDQPCPPRWNATEFGECSRPCGVGGTQARIIRCVHEVSRGSTNVVVLPETLCNQATMPPTEQPCNQVDCPPVWRHGHWSRCSTDCGKGVKRRSVRCVKELAFGGEGEVSETECLARKKPRGIKVCKASHCRYEVSASSSSSVRDLKGGNSTSELSRKSKRNHSSLPTGSPVAADAGGSTHDHNHNHPHHQQQVTTVKVAGKATVIEGSTVKLRCPEWRKRTGGKTADLPEEDYLAFQGPRVHWSKGNERLVNGGKRHHMVRNFLKIKNIKVSDSAVYKCWTEDRETDEHSMFLYVKRKTDATESRPNEQFRNGEMNDRESSGLKKPNNSNNKVAYYKSELDLSEEAHSRYRNGDYVLPSQKNADPLLSSLSTRKESPPTTLLQSNIIADSEDSWELTAQRRLPQSPPLHSHQSPHHQNHRPKAALPPTPNTSLNEVDVDSGSNLLLPEDENAEESKAQKTGIPLSQMLREGTFAWITSEWSKCTIPCGGIGFRMRLSVCYVKLDNVTQAVDSSHCTGGRAKLPRPKSMERCGFAECSFWKAGKWSECDDCLDHHLGQRTRAVNCMLPNGTVLEERHCLAAVAGEKPAETQQCANANCIAQWVAKGWSPCNRNGYRSRAIVCLWKATEKPTKSGSQCTFGRLRKPVTVEQCTESMMTTTTSGTPVLGNDILD